MNQRRSFNPPLPFSYTGLLSFFTNTSTNTDTHTDTQTHRHNERGFIECVISGETEDDLAHKAWTKRECVRESESESEREGERARKGRERENQF